MEVRPPPESVRIWFVGWQVECGRVGSDCEYLNGGWHRQSAQVTKVVGTAGGKLRDGGGGGGGWHQGRSLVNGGWHRAVPGGWHRAVPAKKVDGTGRTGLGGNYRSRDFCSAGWGMRVVSVVKWGGVLG